MPDPPRLSLAFELRAQVGEPQDLGLTRHGRRRIVPILSGSFEGPEIKGRVVPGGADWQLVHPDGFTELDTRYTLETDRGQLIYVQNRGIRHGQAPQVYFRTVPVFETFAPELEWLMRSVFIGVGERYPAEVVIRFWRVE